MANVAAIIGLAGRFSGGPAVEALWRSFSATGGAAVASGPWISRARLFVDCVTEALADVGHATRFDADRTGFFASGEAGDTLATEVAGELGLRGPAVTVPHPALAAVERAVQSLLSGECDLAFAGQVPIGGPGAGVVVLKRLPQALADGDRILAVVCGAVLAPPPVLYPRAGHDPAHPAEMVGEPAPVHERPALANAYAPPTNGLESAIARVWQEQLGIDRVGIDDNFFELGGTSIAGVKIVALLKEWLHQDIPTVRLYEGPTVSALARLLLQSGPAKGYDAVRERGERRRRKLQRLGHGADAADPAAE